MKYLYNLAQILTPEDVDSVPQASLHDNSPITRGIYIFFAISAAVAVLIITISALRIVLSRGNSQDVSKARDAIIYSAVGLAIIMLSFAIVTFVVSNV